MISKNLIKYIHSLEVKKVRGAEKAFVAEGPKVVGELMAVMEPQRLVATREWYDGHRRQPRAQDVLVTEEELRRVSFLQQPQQVLAVFPIPANAPEDLHPEEELYIALDNVQDPGNLGTIIRIADWFGISHIICSVGTADAYNPKVVQATMGSLARVRPCYVDLPAFLSSLSRGVPVYGTFLDGDSLYAKRLTGHGILVMGNEGNGVSAAVEALVGERIKIPSFPPGKPTAESLNVAVATAICVAEFRK